MPKIVKFLFIGLVSHVMGTCIDQDHPEYGDCVQHCETALSLCSSKCDGNTGCINDCEDEETACIGEYIILSDTTRLFCIHITLEKSILETVSNNSCS